MTGEEYIAVLEERRAAYMAERPGQPEWLVPLLEWFIEPGDEHVVTLPAPAPKPERPAPAPRRYRSAASLRAARDQLQARLDALTGTGGDLAAVNLSPHARSRAARNAGRRRMAALDRDVRQAAQLLRRINDLEARIARAEHRERSQP